MVSGPLNARDMKLCFFASEKPVAQETLTDLKKRYGNYSVEECDAIVAIGGDGLMLDVLRAHMNAGKPIYGENADPPSSK